VDQGYDPAEEERKHLEADLVILQTPINWFSAPWTWKKYVDEVFNYVLGTKSMLTGDGRTRSNPAVP
jgi:modulator of drug activity B